MFAALKTKLRRARSGSVDCDKLADSGLHIEDKCATLPARVSSLEGGCCSGGVAKPRTLYWMSGMVGEMDDSLTVSRKDSDESVDSGFHQKHLEDVVDVDNGGGPRKRPPPVRENSLYDLAAVEKAFGPMKDIGRWYSSTYSTSQAEEESRYINAPVRSDCFPEDDRLASRPLPPLPPHESAPPSPPPPPAKPELVYERVELRMLGANGLSLGLRDLAQHGWYWGPVTRLEAEDRLQGLDDGTFLVRDSSDERYLLSLSFRSQSKTLHTRIEYCNGYFSFYSFPDSESEGYQSVVELIERSMQYSQEGVFCFSRARAVGSPAVPVRLLKPLSRFRQVRSLQHYCRFVIRQNIRFDRIRHLPLPRHVHGFLEQSQY